MEFDYKIFRQLINNVPPDYKQYYIHDEFILKLPELKLNLPFIFSCFALSIDGKLCYPDNQSGFTIAQYNKNATNEERNADWWTLNVARSISDAIIIGTTSLKLEYGNYLPCITYDILNQSRCINNLPSIPTVIIICRNLNNINFNDQIFTKDDYPILIICNSINDNIVPNTFKVNYLSQINTIFKKQIIINDSENMLNLFKWLYKIGFKRILNESPYYHHLLLKEQLLDELWLNYSLIYIGGNTATLGRNQDSFTSKLHPEFKILTLDHIAYNFLFTRQQVIY